MRITVIGTGFIGGVLGRALARSGFEVVFGSRHPDDETGLPEDASVVTVGEAIDGADVVILAVPAAAVAEFAAEHGAALSGQLVIDATNRMGEAVSNSRAVLPGSVRYARAFNTLGGEVMADPVFADGRAEMFFSCPVSDRSTLETVIEGVGLHPVYVGPDEEATIDGIFRLWIALAMKQGRGRRLAFRLLEG